MQILVSYTTQHKSKISSLLTNYYQNDPTDFDGTDEEKARVLGGEGTYWSEYIDSTGIVPGTRVGPGHTSHYFTTSWVFWGPKARKNLKIKWPKNDDFPLFGWVFRRENQNIKLKVIKLSKPSKSWRLIKALINVSKTQLWNFQQFVLPAAPWHIPF